MGDPESKANGFLSALRELHAMAPERAEAVVAALSEETVALVRRPPLPVEWIPTRRLHDLLEAAHRVAFDGDLRKITELARRVLLADLKTVYKIFIRMFSAEFALSRAAKIYTTYTRNNGTLEVTARGDRFAELTYRAVARPTPIVWAYYEGAIRGVMAATGLARPDVVMVSGGGNQPDCTFRVTWAG